jgi:hypothetical protein
MKRPSRELVGALAVLVLATGVAAVTVVSLVSGGPASGPRLSAPFATGETWEACGDGPELELARECASSARVSGGAELRSPAEALISDVDDGVCLDLDGGGSVRLAPIDPTVTVGDTVATGDPLGTLPGERVRFAAWSGSGCSGDRVPFDDAHGTRLLCAPDDPGVVVACPVGMLGGVDLQAACDSQYPGEDRVAVTREQASAYAWVCESPAGEHGDIEVSAECSRLFGLDVRAVATDPGDPYSWVCER